ncbi:MAG: translocation/assembly module TamB domain-containing protein [Acidobacteriota bacterium]
MPVAFLRVLRHHRAYRYVTRTLGVAAAILAVSVVTTVTVDLGPLVRERAERLGGNSWKRPIHIGRLSIRLLTGRIQVDDFSIEGLTPDARPFFTARRLDVSLDWSTAFKREITITAVDMTDWQMLVEKWDGRNTFPKFTDDAERPPGPRRFTTTLQHLRAWRGQFTFEDHQAPWSVVARNIDVNIGNLPKYHGTATFTDGTVSIQHYVPFAAKMRASFVIDDGRIHLDSIDFDTDGAKTVATGVIDARRWPEQTYQFKSSVQFARMRELFFKDEKWELAGDGDFTGTFHLFKDGRDLAGTFASAVLGVNQYRFPKLHGSLHWTPTALDVTSAGAQLFGGDSRFTYSIKPLGAASPPTARFEAGFAGVDLASLTDFEQLKGLRFAGTASGERVVLEWPLGRFADHTGSGRLVVTPPAWVQAMAAFRPAPSGGQSGAVALREWGPFAPVPLPRHLPIAGELTYRFGPDQVELEAGRFTTEHTDVTFHGSTAWGDAAHLAFHVTSDDWQESDQLLAGIMTDFGAPTSPVTFGGRGEFDGMLTGAFRRPRVEGEFRGEDLRGFDTWWGAGDAHIVVEQGYVRVRDGIVRQNDSEMRFDGLFSLGFPRDDGGEEMNARIRVVRRDLDSLRHAFGIDEYPVSGLLSGEFQLNGEYLKPVGFGGMTLDRLVAYGEPLDGAAASLRFDGTGVRLDGLTVEKGGGTITGAAFVGWDSTYSFNLAGRRIPLESVSKLAYPRAPLSGIGEFSASGSATFDQPRNDYRFSVNDLFVGDEGVGQVTGAVALRGAELTGEIDAASPRLALTATGRIAVTPQADSEIIVRFHDMSLDPYVRPFVPRLSPFTTAVVSGSVRVAGRLTDVDRLLVDGTIDTVDLRLFDYALKNAAPIRLSLDNRVVKIGDLQLIGDDTRLRLAGTVGLRDERIALQAVGDANLGILQGFFRDVRGSGQAALTAAIEGPLRAPVFSGRATVTGGRVRHFSLPNSLDAINGVMTFDARGVRLDDLSATMGGGSVRFGGRIGFDGYEPGDLNVTVRGDGVQFRFPEGVRSVVDADLTVRGSVKAPTLGGSVVVKSAVYSKRIDAPETILDFAIRRSSDAAVPEAAAAPAVPLKFDIQILVPSTLRVENNLGRGVANADLTLRGTYDRPIFFGHAEVERGELTYKGKRYRVTKGSVDFTNPARIEPFFDIEAETNVRAAGQNYRLVVGATGPTQKLVPSLSSDPPLPAADILALLFSDVRRTEDVELRALQNPTQRQTDLLSASAAETIARPISEAGKIVQRTFGVDTFQLTPFLTDVNSTQASRLNPTARLTIGKRISDRVYLTFSRSLASSINDQIILLEYDASERVSWMLSRNEDSQTYALEFRVRHTY